MVLAVRIRPQVLPSAMAPRCGARRRDGGSCHGPAMPNGRCRMHGGPSAGPRTPEGLERSRRSNWKHGHYSAEAKQVRREARQQYRLLRQLIAAGNEDDVLDLISSTQVLELPGLIAIPRPLTLEQGQRERPSLESRDR